MMTHDRSNASLLACCGLACTMLTLPSRTQARPDPAQASRLLAQLPARFVPNQGQWSSPELYRVAVGGMQVFLEKNGWSFWLVDQAGDLPPGASRGRGWIAAERRGRRAVAVRMTFAGGRARHAVPGARLAGTSSYRIGSATRHRAAVPAYASVLYRSMYAGVDVRVREARSRLEYDLLLEPGADLSRVRVTVSGVESLRIDRDGALVMTTALGTVRQPRPSTWMVGPKGTKTKIACNYVMHGSRSFGFAAPGRDPAKKLVVDPPLLYSTYLGGSGSETPQNVYTDSKGRIVICGNTISFDYPVKTGSFQTKYTGSQDGFITRLDPSQPPAKQLDFSTYIGGAGRDVVLDLDLRPGGFVAFSGQTEAKNLPVTANALQKAHGGGLWDGFAGVLNPTGSGLLALTYLGGTGNDRVIGVERAPNGDYVLAGETLSANFPTTVNANDRISAGTSDAFVARMNSGLTKLVYSTFVGGSGAEWAFPIHADAAGVITLIGASSSGDFPVTTNAFQKKHAGGGGRGQDSTVVRLDPRRKPGSQLTYATFIGGQLDEFIWDGNVLPSGEIVVVGTTASANFPTTPGAYQRKFVGKWNSTSGFTAGDAFVARFDPRKSGAQSLVFSTLFGGVNLDQGLGSAVDSDGVITFVGWTENNGRLPTTPGAMRRTHALNDGYVARMSADGRQLLYGSFLGGTGHDGAWLLARNSDGVSTLAGALGSTDLPLVNAFQKTHAGGGESWIQRVSLIRKGTKRYGVATPGTNGVPTIHALGDATNGNTKFGLACSRGPTNRPGFFLLSTKAWPAVKVLGIALNVDVIAPSIILPIATDTAGESTMPLPLPQSGVGTLYAQFVLLETGTQLLSASDAMRLN